MASFLPAGAWANYAFILISYHLFLAWLVIDADQQTGFSLPVGSTIADPSGLSGCSSLPSECGRHYIPFFGFVRVWCCRHWLSLNATGFSAGARRRKKCSVTVAAVCHRRSVPPSRRPPRKTTRHGSSIFATAQPDNPKAGSVHPGRIQAVDGGPCQEAGDGSFAAKSRLGHRGRLAGISIETSVPRPGLLTTLKRAWLP